MVCEDSQAREKQQQDDQDNADADIEGGVVSLIILNVRTISYNYLHLVTAVSAPRVSAAFLSIITSEVLGARIPPRIVIRLSVANYKIRRHF